MSDTPHIPAAESTPNADRRRLLQLGAGAAVGAGIIALGTATPAAAVVTGGTYSSVTPIRLIDTRTSAGPISAGQTRTSNVLSGAEYCCVCNLTVVNTTGNGGYLSLYSAALATRPSPYSSINWQGNGKVVANLVMFDTGASGFKIYCGSGSADYILDWIGYFTTAGAARSPEQKAFEARANAAGRRLAEGRG